MAWSWYDIILHLSFLFVCFVLYLQYKYRYWERRGVKQIVPSYLLGNFGDLVLGRVSQSEGFQKFYDAGKGEPYIGLYQSIKPVLLIRDPEYVKFIFTKDFPHFHDRGIPMNIKANPLSANLFALEGAQWRNLRIKLTPTFTSGKMKKMFPLMQECCKELYNVLDGPAQREDVVEIKDVLTRFTTDIIGSCAFGVQCNSLRDPDAEFRRYGIKFFERSLYTFLRSILVTLVPQLGTWFPFKPEIRKFFTTAVKNTIAYRKENNVSRNDFMDLLIEIRNKGRIVDDLEEVRNDPFMEANKNVVEADVEFTDDIMTAQAFVFYVAGFETSSTTMSFCMLELSRHPEIQENLYKEIDKTIKKYGELTYEAVMGMPYLDMVVSETMRKYPPIPIVPRKCTKDYVLPNSNVKLRKGTHIFVSVQAIHNDPEIYPDPDRFDPQRFSAEAKASRHHYAYLPFGEGPRICIGSRFGLAQTKLGLATILHKYKFTFDSKTKYPVVFQPVTFLNAMTGGNYMKITLRS